MGPMANISLPLTDQMSRNSRLGLFHALLMAWTGLVGGFAPSTATGKDVFLLRPRPLPRLFYSARPDLQDNRGVFQQAGSKMDPSFLAGERSSIVSVTCENLAGAVSPDGARPIHVSLSTAQPFVACTGETGSGKSLLFAKAIDLISGGRATASMVGGNDVTGVLDEQTAYVEIVLLVKEPHLSFVHETLSEMGVATDTECHDNQEILLLTLRRTLVRSSTGRARTKLKSICTINGHPVSLKALSALTSPLLVVTDAAAAASVLSQPGARLSILDTGVNLSVLQFFAASRRQYQQRRKARKEIERDLSNRVLPQSFSMDSEEDLELVNHWISEIDGLRFRVEKFVASLSTDGRENNSMIEAMKRLQQTDWVESATDADSHFTSALYNQLKGLRDSIRSLDNQWVAASNAAEVLASLSVAESAATALEKARKLLFEALEGEIESNRLDESSETSHNLLNEAEAAIAKCARFIEDSDDGLLSTIENLRSSCPISAEMIDELILDWNTIARKHNISPLSLPSCHKSMILERDGNVQALAQLPKALAAEEEALENFEQACELLSADRKRVSDQLVVSVNDRLPALGMSASIFDISLNTTARSCIDPAAFTGGLDAVEFTLHQGKSDDMETPARRTGGSLDRVASSGEKARILLAMECSLPGCIRASIASDSVTSMGIKPPAPIAVIYDEIDAHVGGRAAVALGHMLADQSLQTQIVAITHSPAVASAADAHVVVKKKLHQNEMLISVEQVAEKDRKKEVARMASGDVAAEEAEAFAEALIRDGLERSRRMRNVTSKN
jgi:DNA repair protein RecN (Recombination protein N)